MNKRVPTEKSRLAGLSVLPRQEPNLVGRMSGGLASRTGRRGFLRLTARLTFFVGGVVLGMQGLRTEAAAYTWLCCTLRDVPWCSNCPNCDAGATSWTWVCCYANCNYQCRECYSPDCSCGWHDGQTCGGGICQPAGPQP